MPIQNINTPMRNFIDKNLRTQYHLIHGWGRFLHDIPKLGQWMEIQFRKGRLH